MEKYYIIRPADTEKPGHIVSCPADQTPDLSWVNPGNTIVPLTESESSKYQYYLTEADRLLDLMHVTIRTNITEYYNLESQLERVCKNARAWCRRRHIRTNRFSLRAGW